MMQKTSTRPVKRRTLPWCAWCGCDLAPTAPAYCDTNCLHEAMDDARNAARYHEYDLIRELRKLLGWGRP
jgi:hypothetical protein